MFVGVGIVFGSIVFGSIILVVIVAVLSRRESLVGGILVGVILTVLVGIVGIFSSVAIVVSIVRIAGFAVIGCRARIAIRHSIRAIFAGMVVSIAVLSRCSTICRYVSVLSRRLPNRLPFLLLLLIRLFRLIARLPLFRHRLRRLFRLRLRLQLRLRLFVRWLMRFTVVRKALCVVIVRCGLSGNILPGNVGNVRSDCVFSIGLLCRFRLLAADSAATLPPSVTVSSANAVAPAPVVPASIAIVTSNAVNFPIHAPHRLMKPASGSFIHFMTCPSLMALRRIAYALHALNLMDERFETRPLH